MKGWDRRGGNIPVKIGLVDLSHIISGFVVTFIGGVRFEYRPYHVILEILSLGNDYNILEKDHF